MSIHQCTPKKGGFPCFPFSYHRSGAVCWWPSYDRSLITWGQRLNSRAASFCFPIFRRLPSVVPHCPQVSSCDKRLHLRLHTSRSMSESHYVHLPLCISVSNQCQLPERNLVNLCRQMPSLQHKARNHSSYFLIVPHFSSQFNPLSWL